MPKKKKRHYSSPPTEQEFSNICSGPRASYLGPVNVNGQQNVISEHKSETQETRKRIWKSIKASLNADHAKLKIPKIPWLDWELTFKDYFVDLSIAARNDTEMKDIGLHEIFSLSHKNTDTCVILIEAPAGYGKSTLAAKLCFDHCNGEKYIQHFKAIILLRLRDLQGSMHELITTTIGLQDVTQEDVIDAIVQNEKKVLLILDGLDELPQNKHEEISPVLRRKQFPLASIVVTSRLASISLPNYEDESSCTNLINCTSTRIIIKGFSKENKMKALESYLKHHSQEYIDLTIELLSQRFMPVFAEDENNLFDCPLFLMLFVIMAEEANITTLKTKTELFKTLFNFLLRRMFAKDEKSADHQIGVADFFEYDKDNPPSYVQSLSQFGYFAAKQWKDQKYAFTEDSISSHMNDDDTIFKLGILRQNDAKHGLKRESWFEPVHLSFLEFSIAYHFWFNLTRGLKVELFVDNRDFEKRPTSRHASLIVPFLSGLCGKHLPTFCANLGSRFESDMWLKPFSDYPIIQDITTESGLKSSELTGALLPLVPTCVVVPNSYDMQSALLKEILVNAQEKNHLQCVILEEACPAHGCVVTSEDTCSSFCKVKFTSNFEWMNDEWQNKVITHQNLEIGEGECVLQITVVEDSLEEQLKLLSEWMEIEGLVSLKPIREVKCNGPDFTLTKSVSKITELIRKETVESIQMVCSENMSHDTWKEFMCSANQSKRLLDMVIIGEQQDTLCAYLDNSSDKNWRRIELVGNIVPCAGSPASGCFEDQIEEVINDLPKCSRHLRVEQCQNVDEVQADCSTYVYCHSASSLKVCELRGLFCEINDAKHGLLTCHCTDLSSLQVLAISVAFQLNSEERDLISSRLISLISQCSSKLRIEFWSGCSEDLITYFLNCWNREIISGMGNHEKNAVGQLDTLMLSHQMASEVHELKNTVPLLKELLKSRQLKYLWLSGRSKNKGYTTPEFMKLFPRAEGFVYEFRSRLAEEALWWPGKTKDATYYIIIFFPVKGNWLSSKITNLYRKTCDTVHPYTVFLHPTLWRPWRQWQLWWTKQDGDHEDIKKL